MAAIKTWKKTLIIAVVALVVIGTAVGGFAWYKFFRVVPQPEMDQEAQFKYGSLGAEADGGVPYLIWLVLPRIFADKLPGPGGWKSFGLTWEPGEELPIGFAKKTVGFPRVTNNCALCHTATYRTRPDQLPVIVPAGPSHTTDVQGIIRFLSNCAKDSRFNADVILDEIAMVQELPWLDRQIWRYGIIPLTRSALLAQESQFAWMNRPGWSHWGPGRDDPMNLTKYFMTSMPVDNSTGNADFPSIWNLKLRDGQLLNWSGDTPAVRSVLIDSALGLGAPPGAPFLKRMDELEAWLKALPPPKYPFIDAIDPKLVESGRALYATHCAACHDQGGKYTGKTIPITEIGTDRERLDTWTQAAADEANRRVKELGIERPNMVKNDGYLCMPLDGLWLRAPYLHNGSVANLRELLEPLEKRSKVFFRGYDLYDRVNLGFVTSGADAEHRGFRFDTSVRGNGNQGHVYGTQLGESEKSALLEYLKTL